MSDKSNMPKVEILKMRDTAEDHRIHKRSTFDLPMRLLIVGKSQLSGKTNTVGNLMLRPFDDTDESGSQFYKKDFDGNDIYIVCPSTLVDHKWSSIIRGKKIPPENVMMKYDEEQLTKLYEKLEEQYHEKMNEGEKPTHKLVILDDCSFGGSLKEKMNGVIARLACNSRHILVSLIVTAQKYSDLLTTLRENATGMMLYQCSNKQMDLLHNDVGEQPKKEFMKMMNDATHRRHTFMVVNYSNDPDERFLDSNFQRLT
tara:strand:+ start:420 stop:1190 length:771 start_codon:yes stop_codon:yes gene_type:complete